MDIILRRKDLIEYSKHFAVENINIYAFKNLTTNMINLADNINFVDDCGRTKSLKFKGM